MSGGVRAYLYICAILWWPGAVLADAGAGQFMGYELGTRYPQGPATDARLTTTGNKVITAAAPVKPDSIAEVSLLATRKTETIGSISASQWFTTERAARESGRNFFQLLRAKYPDWAYGWEVMDAQMQVIAVSMRKPPYELRLNISEDNKRAEQPWHFSITLGWVALSEPDNDWRAQASQEVISLQEKQEKQILKEADVRGL